MTTREAIGIVARELTDEPVVCTTGYTCRQMQAVADRAMNFYMIGSMGLAAAIGLGIALAKPAETVVVLDGDGSLLMGLGILAMIAGTAPKNLLHLVFDNERFASTGNQPTYSDRVPLDQMAAAAGYPVVRRATTPQEVTAGWRMLKAGGGRGPGFLLVKCEPDSGAPTERVRLSTEEITIRFMGALHGR